MARLLKTAARSFGAARYLITDQGGEFTGRLFRKTATRLGIRQRFGTVGNLFATARLERFWRTLKDTASLRLSHLSHSRTWSEGSKRPSPTTCASVRIRDSEGRRPPRPSSGSSPPAAGRNHHRVGDSARAELTCRSPSGSLTGTDEHCPSSWRPRSGETLG